jgi:hypothetical protein
MVDWEVAYAQLSHVFSPWMPWRGLTAYDFMKQPGVYLLAEIGDDSITPSVVDPHIIYIGETTKQTLLERFVQFEEAARTGCYNRHSGGQKYFARTKGELLGNDQRLLPDDLHISIMVTTLDEPRRSAYIRYTERAAIWYFVQANNRYPGCNTV